MMCTCALMMCYVHFQSAHVHFLRSKSNSTSTGTPNQSSKLEMAIGNNAAYAAARCCWCTAPRSLATKICSTSQRQRSTAWRVLQFITFFFTIIAGKLFLNVQQWVIMMQLQYESKRITNHVLTIHMFRLLKQ